MDAVATAVDFAPDIIETDIADLSPVSDQSKRATRWIVFAGDVLEERFCRTFPGMKLGGEAMSQNFKTLSRTKGLLRRCQITPMTVGQDFVNADTVGDDNRSKFKLRQVSALSHDDPSNPLRRRFFQDYYNDCLPGDEIEGIKRTQQGANDKGIREVEVLLGIDPAKPGEPDRVAALQRLVFPKWDLYVTGQEPFFPTTEALGAYLTQRKSEVSDDTARAIIDVLIESNNKFDQYAKAELGRMVRLVKAPPDASGRVYTWEDNPPAAKYFQYCQIKREDLMSRTDTVTNEASNQEYRQMLAIQEQNAEILRRLAERELAGEQGEFLDLTALVCADTNATGEPCRAKVTKKIGANWYCSSHPKE